MAGVSEVAFVEGKRYITAANKANRYAGDGGRIGTMPDNIDPRIETSFDSEFWNTYSSTHTLEFFGLSRNGIPLIVDIHGLGPLETPEGVDAGYELSRNRGRVPKEGRIDRKRFLDLLEGKYGEVGIVELREYMQRYTYPFIAPLNMTQLSGDPLARNRIGERVVEFAEKHAELAHQELMAKGAAGKRIVKGEIPIVRLQDPANNHYVQMNIDRESAMFHLLHIARLMDHITAESELYAIPREIGIPQTDIYCREGNGFTRLLAVKFNGV